MTDRIDSGILTALTNLGTSITKQAEAADPPTDHPVGSAPDGDQPASEGQFAKENEQYAKENAGPAGVEAAPEDAVNPQKKQDDLPAQEELNPTSADGEPPEEIKPKKVVTSGDDDDKGELGGDGEGSGESEGNVGGVGGPKFDEKSASIISGCDDWLKEASAIIPEVETPAEEAPAEGEESKEASASDDQVSEDEAAELERQEKVAQEQIASVLTNAGISDDAPLAEKRAAIVKAVAVEAEKAANGFILSLDEETLKSVLDGTFQKAAQDDPSAAMPAAVPAGDMGGAPPAASIPGAAPPPEAAGAAPGGESPDEMIAKVFQAVQTGEISPEEALELFAAMGLPPEVIQVLQQELANVAGAAGAAPGGVPDPAAAGAAPPPPEAAGAEASAEDMVTA